MEDSSARTKKIVTFSIFDETAYTSRQYTFSHTTLLTAGIGLLICVVLFATVFIQCLTLRNNPADSRLLESRITGQKQQINMRDQQIALLGSKLTGLEDSLANLKSLQGEIRHVARIERTSNQESLFGVGGAKPESEKQAAGGTGETATADAETRVTQENREAPGGATELFYAARRNRLTLVLDHADFIINPMTCMPLDIPVTGIVQKAFDTQDTMATGTAIKKGIEIRTPCGAEVVAPANGIITYAGEKKPLGHMVVIDHGHGIITRYENMRDVTRKAGDTVKKGEIIGFVSDRETDSYGYLHYEVLFNGVQIDPEACVYNPPFII
ncbi:MAG: murein hydrolase activator EnvC family protein [Thermodesulfobacteriota bacterium]